MFRTWFQKYECLAKESKSVKYSTFCSNLGIHAFTVLSSQNDFTIQTHI